MFQHLEAEEKRKNQQREIKETRGRDVPEPPEERGEVGGSLPACFRRTEWREH